MKKYIKPLIKIYVFEEETMIASSNTHDNGNHAGWNKNPHNPNNPNNPHNSYIQNNTYEIKEIW